MWKVNATYGERVGVGETVLSTVSCSKPFLLASVPQDRVPEILLGGQARFRLAGEPVEHTGTVISVSESAEQSSQKFASRPIQKIDEHLATVMIGLNPAVIVDPSWANSCGVGRTARVLIPIRASSGMSSFWARLF